MEIRVRITVEGLVQGVGFRYFARRKANELGIFGYAKNLYNGDVEIEAVGEKALIDEYIKFVRAGPSNSHVKKVSVEELPFEKLYSDFSTY